MVSSLLLKVAGVSSTQDYINLFFKTLMKTNQTYEYFVDWKKSKKK